jgi:hypothetical protein
MHFKTSMSIFGYGNQILELQMFQVSARDTLTTTLHPQKSALITFLECQMISYFNRVYANSTIILFHRESNDTNFVA